MLCENYRIERFPYRALNNPFVMNIGIEKTKQNNLSMTCSVMLFIGWYDINCSKSMEYYICLDFLYIFIHHIHMGLHVLIGCSFPYILQNTA